MKVCAIVLVVRSSQRTSAESLPAFSQLGRRNIRGYERGRVVRALGLLSCTGTRCSRGPSSAHDDNLQQIAVTARHLAERYFACVTQGLQHRERDHRTCLVLDPISLPTSLRLSDTVPNRDSARRFPLANRILPRTNTPHAHKPDILEEVPSGHEHLEMSAVEYQR